MTKAEELAELAAAMAADSSLPLVGKANLVFGEGNPEHAVMFIGEAPGYNEDVARRPFVGRAGQLLREMIRAIGWREEDVYITNIVKRRPPDNRDPLPEEIEAYKPYLARQIGIIDPKAIIPLGRFSMNYFLPEAKITRDQGRSFWCEGRLVIPMLHPAAALRAPAMREAFERSMRLLPNSIEGGSATPVVAASSPPDLPTSPKKPRQSGLF